MAQTKPIKLVECAFGDVAKITRCLGYCKKHKCYLAKKNIENMNCLKKGCFHFVKLENQYWNELEKKQSEKNKRKENRRNVLNGEKN